MNMKVFSNIISNISKLLFVYIVGCEVCVPLLRCDKTNVINDMHAPIKTIADNKLTTREHQSETHCNINNHGKIYRQVHKLVRKHKKICVYDQNFVFGDM